MQKSPIVRLHLRRWRSRARVLPTMATIGTSAEIRQSRAAYASSIAPWNYPFNPQFSAARLGAPAGQANSAPIPQKPSENDARATSRLIAEILWRRVFSPGSSATCHRGRQGRWRAAPRATVRPHLLHRQPAGRQDRHGGCPPRTLPSVTLELWRKSPTHRRALAADSLRRRPNGRPSGASPNAGQTCIAPDHVFVHHLRGGSIITAALRAEITNFYGAVAEKSARLCPHRSTITHAERPPRASGRCRDQGRQGRPWRKGEGRFLEPHPDRGHDARKWRSTGRRIFGPHPCRS